MHCYQHYIVRRIYYEFTMHMARKNLKQNGFKHVHIKPINDMSIIGVKNDKIKRKYAKQIPEDIFDRRNYHIHQHHS